jgi:DNA-directed RNA polymerase subunit omega
MQRKCPGVRPPPRGLDRHLEKDYVLLTMVLPLDLLEGFQGNIYEMTCAAMKRSIQINLAGDDELDANHGKIVSTAIKQILTRKVRYQHPEA